MLKKSYSPLNAKTFFQRFKTSFLKQFDQTALALTLKLLVWRTSAIEYSKQQLPATSNQH